MKEAARPPSPPPPACSCPRGECAHPESPPAAIGQAGWAPWRRWQECFGRAVGARCIPTPCLPLSPPSISRTTLGWGRWVGGTKGLGAQVPQRSGGFVYKQWGAGSAAPPGGQCGPGEVSRPRLPRPPQSGRGARGGAVCRGGHTPGARPLGAATGGGSRAVESAAPAGGGCAPATAGYWPLARLAGGAGARGGGVGGVCCDSRGGRLGPPWERACAGLWICRCLAWVCACVWLRVCAGVCRGRRCQSRGMLGLWPVGVCA